MSKGEKCFVVDITRTETYKHTVKVMAKDEREAKGKVQQHDYCNGFSNEWNELTPEEVVTAYEATEAIDTTLDDETISRLKKVE